MKKLNGPKIHRTLRLGSIAIALTLATTLGGCGGGGEPGVSTPESSELSAVAALVEELQGADESKAASAASALGQTKDPAVIDPLIAAATGSDSASVRKFSTMALQWFDEPKAIAALVTLMHSGEGELAGVAQQGFEFGIGQSYTYIGKGLAAVKADQPDAYEAAFKVIQAMTQSPEDFKATNAVTVLGQTGDPRATAVLLERLKNGNDFQRTKVVEALGTIKTPEAIAALKDMVADDNSVVAKAASDALRKAGHVDIGVLKQELKQRATREAAIAALGEQEGAEALQILATELKDASFADRDAILDAIGGRSSDPAAAEVLLTFMKSENGQRMLEREKVALLNTIGDLGNKTGDGKIAQALIAAYQAEPKGFPLGAVSGALTRMGDTAYGAAVTLLSHEDAAVRSLGVTTLGGIGKKEAIAPLTGKLADWFVAPKAIKALETMGWEPTSDRERVLVWLANRDKAQLKANWDVTKTVLLGEARNGSAEAVTNALRGFVGIGDPSVLPDLKTNLNNRGNKDVALAYLNCGQPELEAAAQSWARRNGFKVVKLPGAGAAARWGQL